MKSLVVVALLVTCGAPVRAQQEADPWKVLAFLAGEWKGEESASFGRGEGERVYRFILGDRYLLSQNRSTFPPQEGLSEGQVHEDWSIFSYDRARESFVLRQFNSEGFVNRFVLDPSSALPQRAVFVSEASENAPPGLRARLTYERVDDSEFKETFELAMPEKDFAVVLRNRWRRAVAEPDSR